MIRDLDIYRSANVLIREYGEDAALDATTRAIAMLGFVIYGRPPDCKWF